MRWFVIANPADLRAFDRLVEIPGVECRHLKDRRWLVRFESNEWFVWPHSGRWAHAKNGEQTSDLYYGGIRFFVARYIKKTIHLPANQCKLWTEEEMACIAEMCDMNMSINQIAAELQRHPEPTAFRVEQLFEIDLKQLGYLNDLLFDIGMNELLENVPDSSEPSTRY